MAVWDPSRGHLSVTGGLRAGIRGLDPVRLTSMCQPLASSQPARCITFATTPALGRHQELLWWDDKKRNKDQGDKGGVTAEIVTELCQQGHLSKAVEALGVLVQTDRCISKTLIYTVLKKCIVEKDLVMGGRVHAFMVKAGHQSDTFLCNHILRMYASLGRLADAMDVFTSVAKPDVFTWSAIISAHVKHGQDKQAIQLYHWMRRSGVKPDGHVFAAALQACGKTSDLNTGQQVHADVLANCLEPHLFVYNGLMDMYVKCGSLEHAQKLFDGLGKKDVVTWTALIAGYTQKGMGQEALRLYSVMQEEAMAVHNSTTFVCLLQACASVGPTGLEKGKQLHMMIEEQGHQDDVFVASSLVNMYAKCGSLEDAHRVFDGLGEKNVVTWTALIAGYAQQGMGQKALRVYSSMQEEGIAVPNSVTFVCLLQACASVGTPALEKGKGLHRQIREQGHQVDVSVANSLVNMYAKCGSLEDAQRVFDGLGQKDVVTWNALIAGYSQQGMWQETLRLYGAMQEENIAVPDSVTFVCLLQACGKLGAPAFEIGKKLHAQIRQRGHEAHVFVASSLVNMYAKCGCLVDAQKVFDGLNQKDVVTWNALIAGYSQHGMLQEALDLYGIMQEEGFPAPNSVTFVSLLQAFSNVGTRALEMGKQLHAQIRELGHQADVFVANNLVNMYAKCGSLEDAQRVFDGLIEKNIVTWTALIAGYSQEGMGQEALHVYSEMEAEGMVVPDSVTFVCLLQACASVGTPALGMGKQLHAQIRDTGQQADLFIANSIVSMYAKCGSLEDAERVFYRLEQKDVITWNAMIAGYSQQNRGEEALCVYRTMQEEGLAIPDFVTFLCLLQACANVGTPALEMGKQLHAQIREQGHETDMFLASSLLSMYAKCGSLADAKRVFEGLQSKDVAAWNAMIAGYSEQGMGQEALRLYDAMQEEGVTVPDSVTFACLLQACATLGTPGLAKGKQLHAEIREQGLQADPFVANSLVSMYAKCGSLQDAHTVFNGLGQKDVAIWNAMIAGYSQQGMGQEALRLYAAMQDRDMAVPNSVTFVCLLQACANVAALQLGRQLHAQIVEQGLQADVFIAGSLINMYGKSGSMVDAQQVFDVLTERDVVAWSALIAGYASQGDSEVVFNLVQRMTEDKLQPVGITFLSVLAVCSHSGLVGKGKEYFKAMSRQYGITPMVEHYTCMVDLLGRAGRLEEALTFVRTMPVLPTAAIWHTLLGACREWSNVEVGRHAFDEAVKLDKKDAAAYVLMSNIYTSTQMWEKAEEMQERRVRTRAFKQPGQSWWTDIDGLVHSFLVGGTKISSMTMEGYMPDQVHLPADTSVTRTASVQTCYPHQVETHPRDSSVKSAGYRLSQKHDRMRNPPHCIPGEVPCG